MKVFVAIPTYDRKVTCETVGALLDEQMLAAALGIDITTGFVPGSSLVHQARDQAVASFLASDADRMVFVDADVAWAPGALLKIATAPLDFVGGCYRFKQEPEGYPIEFIKGREEIWADPETGCIEVAALPAGFLSLSRSVFETLQAAHPVRSYVHGGQTFHAYFHCPPGGGEDGTFCGEWRATGGGVWLDPTLTLTHVEGGRQFTGCIGDWMRARSGLAVAA